MIQIIDYRPPRIALLFVLVAILLHWATPLSQLHVYSNPLLGVILAISGFGVMLWGWWLFRVFGTAICPTAKADRLVTTGIYRVSRNPMYLGIVSMLLGGAIFVGTFPFYLAAIVYFLVLHSVFCPYEENRLAEAFGDTYISYKNKVRRWF